MTELWKYENCLVCGDKNEIGMNLPFDYDGEVAATEYTAEARFEGYKEVLHGGILTALLDEVMAKAIFGKKILAATVEIKVKFKKPVKTGEKIKLEGNTLVRGEVWSLQAPELYSPTAVWPPKRKGSFLD